MKSHQILAHTADVQLKIEGTTLEEFFQAGLEGMNAILKPNFEPIEFDLEKPIKIQAADTTAMLIDFLSEVLALSQINHALFGRFEGKILANSLAGKVFGLKITEFDKDIKAVTYHGAEVKKNQDGNFETIILFDI